ncbi:mitochondrial import receptor subunit TOM20 homolog [Drosophila obscura]|uniref:mitochondrial import receptor subunit TOM20 homolog n=1 Tax=Drosophila obscura TaxID=7282 RepID=UPI000BA0BA34|nr:mitochondrial import receptor subunit TOM20 homolog [Drosophila obscura]
MISGTCKLLAITAISSVLGYCVYFDKKRRTDPDYKRKLHARRRKAMLAKEQQQRAATTEPSTAQVAQTPAQALRGLVKTNTEQYFLEQIHLGEHRLMIGDIDAGITHMVNATSVCTHQETFLQMLESTLPVEIFSMFLAKLQHAEQTRSYTNSILPHVLSSRTGIAW